MVRRRSLTEGTEVYRDDDHDLEPEAIEAVIAPLSRDSSLAKEAFSIGRDSDPCDHDNAVRLAAFGCRILLLEEEEAERRYLYEELGALTRLHEKLQSGEEPGAKEEDFLAAVDVGYNFNMHSFDIIYSCPDDIVYV